MDSDGPQLARSILQTISYTTAIPVQYNQRSFNVLEQVIVPIFYCIISFVGLFGNVIVLYIMRSMVKTKSVTDVYVSNLAVADILLLSTLPFWAAELILNRWVFGMIMCKIASCMTYLNMYASVFFLAIMSLDRWLAIVKAIKCRSLRTVQKARIISIIIWSFSLLFIILPSLFRTTKRYHNGERCVWDFPMGWKYQLNVFYNVMRSVVGFFIPLVVILFCYSDLIRFMRTRNKKKRKTSTVNKGNKITKMVLVVISCFIISWLPNQVTNFVHLLKLLGFVSYGCSGRHIAPQANTTGFLHASTIGLLDSTLNSVESATVANLMNNLTTMEESIETGVRQLLEITSSRPAFEPCVSAMVIMYVHLFTACLGFSNSMMNPLVYSCMGAMFRKKLFKLLTCSPDPAAMIKRNRKTSMWNSMRHTTTTRLRTSTVSFGRRTKKSTVVTTTATRLDKDCLSPPNENCLSPPTNPQPIWTRKQDVGSREPIQVPEGLFPDYDYEDEVEEGIPLQTQLTCAPVTHRTKRYILNQPAAKQGQAITGVSVFNDSDESYSDDNETLNVTHASPINIGISADEQCKLNLYPQAIIPSTPTNLCEDFTQQDSSHNLATNENQTDPLQNDVEFGGVWMGDK